jgi:predicted AlkP superfamily pyrophosphatase or phosphodiesterase
MINERSIDAVNAARWSSHFTKPLYDSYCFSRLPSTIHYLLTGEDGPMLPLDVLGDLPQAYDKVILMYVDAFGWRFFEERIDRYPFLKRVSEQGVASKITSLFPSTTTVHTTNIHLGEPVSQTGIYEWFYYEPLLDRLIAPLIFSYAGDKENGTIKLPGGVNLNDFFRYQTVYQKLANQGAKSYLFQLHEYQRGGFANLVLSGAERRGYKTLSEGLVNLAEAVAAEKGKAYFFYYYDSIDSVGHIYGPSSRQFEAEIDTFLHALEYHFHKNLIGKTSQTLLLITSDHGQIDVSPHRTIYLNQHFPQLQTLIRTDGEGRLLVPAGSARDIFLYIRGGRVDEAYSLLAHHPIFESRAEVHRVSELMEKGYFGWPLSEAFRQRIADLVILAYPGEAVWWFEKDRFDMRFYGHHGGLTPDEVEIPLLAFHYTN